MTTKGASDSGERYWDWRLFIDAFKVWRSALHWFGAEASHWQQALTIINWIALIAVGVLAGRSIDTQPQPAAEGGQATVNVESSFYWVWGGIIGLILALYGGCYIYAHYKRVTAWRSQRDDAMLESEARLNELQNIEKRLLGDAQPKPSELVIKARGDLTEAVESSKEHIDAPEKVNSLDVAKVLLAIIEETVADREVKKIYTALVNARVAIATHRTRIGWDTYRYEAISLMPDKGAEAAATLRGLMIGLRDSLRHSDLSMEFIGKHGK